MYFFPTLSSPHPPPSFFFFLFWQPLKFVICTSNLTARKDFFGPLFSQLERRWLNIFAWFSLMWSSLFQSLNVSELYSFSKVISCQNCSHTRFFKRGERSDFSKGPHHLRSLCTVFSLCFNFSFNFTAHVPFQPLWTSGSNSNWKSFLVFLSTHTHLQMSFSSQSQTA